MPADERMFIGAELERRFSAVVPITTILLVHPPALPEGDFDYSAANKKRYSAFPPYGLLVIAQHLRRADFNVSIVDLNYIILEAVRTEPVFDYTAVWRTALHRAVDSTKPDMIGVTCMFTMTHSIFVDVVCEAKRYASVPVVIGGVHVTNDTERVLREIDVADVACIHEAEISFLKLLQFLNRRGRKETSLLAQLACIADGDYRVIKDRLSPTPQDLSIVPAFDLIPTAHYASVGSIGSFISLLPQHTKISTVLANRGCRAQCTFCSVRFFNGPGVRGRSIASIVGEVEALINEHGIEHIMWLDDDLFYGDPVGLFNEMIRRNLRVTWDASNGVIAAAMTPEIVAAASESGCVGLFFGFESGNMKMLREMKKPGTVDQYRKAAEMIRQYPHIFTRAFLMIGFPHETLGMMMETMNFAIEIGLDWYNITILQPLPSTPLYKSMLEEGLLEDRLTAGEVKFQVGPFGKQTQIERQERERARPFREEFLSLKPFDVPSKGQLNHIWFLMNYKANYERIRTIDDPIKLRILRPFLDDIADRVTQDHALAQWSAAVVNATVQAWEVARERIETVERILGASAYWRDKFEAFDLDAKFVEFKHQVVQHLTAS